MKLKRSIWLLFLVLSPLAYAEIDLNLQEKETYNLGDKISPQISVKGAENQQGFFSLRIMCTDFNVLYYTLPLSLEAGQRTQLTVPELETFDLMEGTCRLKAAFDANSGAKIDSASSNEFLVTKDLKITTNENLEANPGDEITLEAKVRTASGTSFSGHAEVHYMNQQQKVEAISGILVHKIKFPYDTAPGFIPVKILVSDQHGNYGEKNLNVEINPIPTKIENQIENSAVTPGDTLRTKVVLYDHNANILDGRNMDVKILDPAENQISEVEVTSSSEFGLVVDNSFPPGEYYIVSVFEDLQQQSAFTVQELRKIAMKQDGNFVHIENAGNVDYDDEVTIVLENEKKYLVNKKIRLKPQESMTLDLSKEVPRGTYDMTLPQENYESNADNDELETATVIKDVPIEDNRNLLKKTGSGLSGVTGAVISAASIIASKPKLASIALVTIILGVVTYYSRGVILRKVKGKNKNDTEDLFQDYDFKNENNKL
jgi:hypothetical protein